MSAKEILEIAAAIGRKAVTTVEHDLCKSCHFTNSVRWEPRYAAPSVRPTKFVCTHCGHENDLG